MRPFLDLWRPSHYLPPHLSLTMWRQIPRDEARRYALDGGYARFEDDRIEALVSVDLDAALPHLAHFTAPKQAWEAVMVEHLGGVLVYWLIQVR